MKVLVTGVSTGLGRVLAGNLIKKGYEVWGIARQENLLLSLKEELNSDKFYFSQCDISERKQVEDLCQLLLKENFIPDVYILNAAITSEPVEDHYEAIIVTNLIGSLHVIEQVLAKLPMKFGCQVIAISSLFAVLPDNRNYAYASSKSGLSSAIQSLCYDPRFKLVKFKNVFLGPIDSVRQLKGKSLFISSLDFAAEKTVSILNSSEGNYYYTPLNYIAIKLFPFFPIKLTKFLYLKLRR